MAQTMIIDLDVSGNVTMPYQPALITQPATTNHSITTTGDTYMVSSNWFTASVRPWNAHTILEAIGMPLTGRFTQAPVAGRYQFQQQVWYNL